MQAGANTAAHIQPKHILQQRLYLCGQKAQILGNDGRIAKPGLQRVDERPAGAGQPAAAPCRTCAERDGVIAFKPPKVVYPHLVKQTKRRLHAL